MKAEPLPRVPGLFRVATLCIASNRRKVFSNLLHFSLIIVSLLLHARMRPGESCYAQDCGVFDTAYDPGLPRRSSVNAIALQADGKVLVAVPLNAIRLNPDATIDKTFSLGSGTDGGISAILVQSDQKIIIGGSFAHVNGKSHNGVARLNPDGSVDASFSLSVGGSVYALAFDSQGRILIGGDSSSSISDPPFVGVLRTDRDGNIDATFDAGFGVGSGDRFFSEVWAFAVQPDGKILLAGDFGSYDGVTREALARINSDGTLDRSFSINSLLNYPEDDFIAAVALDQAGKILVGGSFSTKSPVECENIMRLNADGSQDLSFVAQTSDLVQCVVIVSDSECLIGGYFDTVNGTPRSHIAKLTSAGLVSPAYQVATGSIEDEISAFARQSDGTVLAGGTFERINGLVRNGLFRFSCSDNSTIPKIVLQPIDQVALVGRPVIFTVQSLGAAPLTYQWLHDEIPIQGAVDSTLKLSSVTLTDKGKYSVRVTNVFGSVQSADALLTVSTQPLKAPSITAQPRWEDATVGGTVAFTVQASGSPPLAYQWFHDGNLIEGALTSTLTLSPVSFGDAGAYFVLVTNGVGSEESEEALLFVFAQALEVPSISTQPHDQSAAVGSSVTFSVQASGSQPLKYQWFHNGAAVPGGTNSTLTLSSAALTDVGTYSVSVENAVGSAKSTGARLVVNSPAPVINTQPQSVTVEAGKPVSFSVDAIGAGPLLFQWFLNGSPIPGATNSIFAIDSTSAHSAGSYQARISNVSGSTNSAIATLAVLAIPGSDLVIEDTSFDSASRLTLRYRGTNNCYYVLLRGEDVQTIVTPIVAQIGQSALQEITSPERAPTSSSAFYRLVEKQVNNPGDLDGDGIDDVFELTHKAFLNPLDSSDAALSSAGDFVSNLEKYRRGLSLDKPVIETETVRISYSAASNTNNPTSGGLLQADVPVSLGNATAVRFFMDGRLLGTSKASPFTLELEAVSPGSHQVKAEVTVGGVLPISSDTIRLVVSDSQTHSPGNAPFRQTVAAGNSYVITIAADGTLWGLGNEGNSGLFGIGTEGSAFRTPKQLSPDSDWRSVSTGWASTLGLRADGSIWQAGRVIGASSYDNAPWSTLFEQVGTDTDWSDVFVREADPNSESTRFALKNDGSLWVWGTVPINYQLTRAVIVNPSRLSIDGRVTALSMGPLSSFAGPLIVTEDGAVWSAMPDGTFSRVLTFGAWVQVEWSWTQNAGVGLKSDGTLWWILPGGSIQGSGSLSSLVLGSQIGQDSDWKFLTGSWLGPFVAVKNNGSLWSWYYTATPLGQANQAQPIDAPLGPFSLTPVEVGQGTGWLNFQTAALSGPNTINNLGLKADGNVWEISRWPWPHPGVPPDDYNSLPVQVVKVFQGPIAFPGQTRPQGNSSDTAIPGAVDATGNLPINFSVDSLGGANVSLPISVPPGTARLQPKLSVTYNSHGGNGLLGMGTTLSGLSIITRVPRTLAQDGVSGGVQFNAGDRFALDGQRLMAPPILYGTDNVEYRTEIDSFSRIISFGQSGNGPASFKVWTKAGQILEYGNTDDSKLLAKETNDVISWALNRVEDLNGNYLTISYLTDVDNGEQKPSRIDYTGNRLANSRPYASVQFRYSGRPDVVVGKVGPYAIRVASKLASIQTFVEDAPVFLYTFAYEQGTETHRTRLKQITLSSADGTSFPPTKLDQWTDIPFGERSFIPQEPIKFPSGYELERNDYNYVTGDFNGDGRADVLHLEDSETFSIWYSRPDGSFDVHRNLKRDGVGDYVEYKDESGPNPLKKKRYDLFYFRAGDFNGDGKTDFVHPSGTVGKESSAEIWIADPTEQKGFKVVPCYWFDHLGNGQAYGDLLKKPKGSNLQYLVGDFNGDGLSDVIHVVDSDTIKVWISRKDRPGEFELVVWVKPNDEVLKDYDFTENIQNYFAFDLDGDGNTDLMHFASSDRLFEWLSNGNGTFRIEPRAPPLGIGFTLRQGLDPSIETPFSIKSKSLDFRTGDFNGDGRTDFIHFLSPTVIQFWISTGNGDFTLSSLRWSQMPPALGSLGDELANDYNFEGDSKAPYAFSFGDFNGDGKTDFIHFFDKTHAFLWLSRGNGTFEVTAVPQSMDSDLRGDANYKFLQGDFNGDGKSDLLHVIGKEGARVWIQNGPFCDLLTHAIDGQQNEVEITYAPLTDSSVYTADSGSSYPTQDLRGPLYVVSAYRVSDTQAGLHEFRYKYYGAKTDLNGRGFLGFRSIARTDMRSGFWSTSEYSQQFPYLGQLLRSEIQQQDKRFVSQLESTLESRALSPIAPHYFVFTPKTVSRAYEIDGSLVTSITSTSSYDDNGNLKTAYTETSDGFSKTVVNLYTDPVKSPDRWVLGRIRRSEKSSSATDAPTQTRTLQYDYFDDWNLKEEIIEPDHPNLSLKARYLYDQFGNRTNTTLLGADIATRASYTEYDSVGRFVVRTVNPLGHEVNQSLDSRFGGITNVVDPNHLASRATFDGFGRKLWVKGPDGTSVEWRYSLPDSDAPKYSSYMVQTLVSGRPPSITYLDKRERPLRQSTHGFDGRLVFEDTEYDFRDNPWRTSRPYFKGEEEYWVTNQFDDFRRVTNQMLPDGTSTSFGYHGLSKSVTNALGRHITQVGNSQGQLVEAIDHYGRRVTFDYDSFGNLLRVTDPTRNVTTATYDLRGRKTSLNDPDMGIWYYTNSVLGELIAQKDAKNQVTTLEYDLLGRVIHRTEPEGESGWLYDTAPYGIGALAQAEGPNGYSLTNYFDSLGRPSSSTVAIGEDQFTFANTYDEFSRVKIITYPSGFVLANVYNEQGYLFQTKNETGDSNIWTLHGVNASGQATKELFGNGIATTRTFSPERGWIHSVQSGPGGTLQDLRYGFNALGNLEKREDLRQALSESFSYDALNRLTNGVVEGQVGKTYEYDALGNLTKKSDVGSYRYGGNGGGPHAVWAAGADQFFYDANGNQVSGAGRAIDYTSFNKPASVIRGSESAAFDYDINHAPMIQVATAAGVVTKTIYIGGLYEVVTHEGTQEERHYLPSGGGISAVFTRESTAGRTTAAYIRYLHGDHLGSIEAISDEIGIASERFSYDAFGKRRDSTWQDVRSGSLSSKYTQNGFTGHLQLDGLDLIHMGGRIYDPLLGRVLSADPIVQGIGDLQAFNRYSYVVNNPLSLTDPSGYEFVAVGEGDGPIAAGAAVSDIPGGGGIEWTVGGGTAVGNSGSAGYSPVVDGNAHGLVESTSAAVQRGEVASEPQLTQGEWDSMMRQHAEIARGLGIPFQAPSPPPYLATQASAAGSSSLGSSFNWDFGRAGRHMMEDLGLLGSAAEMTYGALAWETGFGFAAANHGADNLMAGLFHTRPATERVITAVTGSETAGRIGNGALGVVLSLGTSLGSSAVAAKNEVTVYRVFGGDSRAQGFSWTTKDPRTVANFRDGAGLPSGGASGANNTADFLIQGKVNPADIIKSRPALPLDGNKGGLQELIIDPKNVKLTDFSVLKP